MCGLWILTTAANPATPVQSSFEIKATAPAVNGDFVTARKKAVNEALRLAVETVLKQILGASGLAAHEATVNAILKKPDAYVKSYRFLDSQDKIAEQSVEVTVEVTLFVEALRGRLGAGGAHVEKAESKSILILVQDRAAISPGGGTFWDLRAVCETLLIKYFGESGLRAVGREALRGLVSEELVLRAVKGDLGAAAEIGARAGAGVVVVGNSLTRELAGDSGQKTVEAGVNLKGLDVRKSRIIAAKSELASQRRPNAQDAEQEALQQATRKQADFFIASIAGTAKETPPAVAKPPAAAEEF
jgi:hypothetical protein